MAVLFNITTPTDRAVLDGQRTGKVVFTISNTSGRALNTRASILPADDSTHGWFTLEGQASRRLAREATEQFVVNIAVPPAAKPGDYTFKLLVVEESNPDENFSESPSVRVVVPAPVVVLPTKRKFPWWIIAIAVIAVILAIGVIIAVSSQSANESAAATQTAAAVPVEPTAGPTTAFPTVVPTTIPPQVGFGTINNTLVNAAGDSYSFFANANSTITIRASSSAFDTILTLRDPSGNVIDRNDDSEGTLNSLIRRTLTTAGLYTFTISSFGSSRTGAYTLVLSPG